VVSIPDHLPDDRQGAKADREEILGRISGGFDMNARRKKEPVKEPKRFNYEVKFKPYNTGKVLIGGNYFPKTNYVDKEGEKVQAALLGIESDFSRRRVRNFIFYMLFVVFMFFLAITYEELMR
jgi:hypothetical protein